MDQRWLAHFWDMTDSNIHIDAVTGFGNLFALLQAIKAGLREVAKEPGTLLALLIVKAADFPAVALRLGEEKTERLQARIAAALNIKLTEDSRTNFRGHLFRVAAGEFAFLIRHDSCQELTDWILSLKERLHLLTWSYLEASLPFHISAACFPCCAASLGHLLAYTNLYLSKDDPESLTTIACPGSPEHQDTQFLSMELHNNATDLIESFCERMLNTAIELGEARQMAFTDPMTQLPNQRAARYYLNELLKEAARIKVPLSLMLIDGDNLGDYNERFGYLAGNDMIYWLGQQTRRLTPETCFVARWLSGDEFLVLYPGADGEACRRLAEELRTKLHEASRELLIPITVSVGTAAYPADGKTSAELLQAIETANRQAKQSGRNQVAAFQTRFL